MGAIPLSSISLSEIERAYVTQAMADGMLSSTGPFVSAFERAFAERIGVNHVVATASGSSALQLIMSALRIERGDEVIMPALTFAAPASVIIHAGARPVFCDIDQESWTLDPQQVEQAITPNTKAILAVDVFGHPCNYDALTALGVPVIEDAAEAHGAFFLNRPVGSFGIASAFSFFANKAIGSGEGGCVCTDDSELAARLRMLNNFGMDPQRRYWHLEAGFNHRMTNLTAAVALGQVERWDELMAGRAAVTALYDALLSHREITRRPRATWAKEATWLYTVATRQRTSVLASCKRRGIDAREIWPIVPISPAFSKFANAWYPIARQVAATAMWLPTWSDMPEDVVRRVVDAVVDGLEGGDGNEIT
jgi:perosamine synthetase